MQTATDFLVDPNNHTPTDHSTGLTPRDYAVNPAGSYDGIPEMGAVSFPLIPESEWEDRIRDKVASKSQLSDIRLTSGPNGGPIPSLDQNDYRGHYGYCWAHSSTHGNMLIRAVQNSPYVQLSAFMVAAIIKGYRDEGGWGALSMEFIMKNGQPSTKTWPQLAVNRSLDTPDMRTEAVAYKITGAVYDVQSAVYDQKLNRQQVASLLLSNCPVVSDFNWWGHSVLAMDLVSGAQSRSVSRADSGKLFSLEEFDARWGMNVEGGGYATRIWNSWSDTYGDRGMGVLTGAHAWPDSAVGISASTAA